MQKKIVGNVTQMFTNRDKFSRKMYEDLREFTFVYTEMTDDYQLTGTSRL